MKPNHLFSLVATLVLQFFLSLSGAAASQSVDLKSEHLIKPIGVDVPKPRLSWRMRDPEQGAFQTAYRVYVGTDSLQVAQGKGEEWDSEKVYADSNLITYKGKTLQPFTRYFWSITLWNQAKKSGSYVFEIK